MPGKAFEKFINDLLVPWLQRTKKWDYNCQAADLFISSDVLTNTLVHRLFFQNQFALQKIFDTLLNLSDKGDT
jgi:hypothetical protein